MFKLFKRSEPPAKPAARRTVAAAKPTAARSAPPVLHEPPPAPDVLEMHDESAWDLWEHSQMQLDSQMSPLSAYDSVRVNTERPSQFSDVDPFERVRRKAVR